MNVIYKFNICYIDHLVRLVGLDDFILVIRLGKFKGDCKMGILLIIYSNSIDS